MLIKNYLVNMFHNFIVEVLVGNLPIQRRTIKEDASFVPILKKEPTGMPLSVKNLLQRLKNGWTILHNTNRQKQKERQSTL